MSNPKGFLKIRCVKTEYRPVCERVADYGQVFKLRPDAQSQEQATRCMDCGTPFCHSSCPLGNYIPEWNDFMSQRFWDRSYALLSATNNLPEVTGRVCPAPCEYSCVLGINDDAVTIRENELGVIEHAFKEGIIKANSPKIRTGKKVAVIGSGPAGLSAAAQLNSAGHSVTVFERDQKIGGIMRYGIPDFKLEKNILDRRIDIWKQEGIEFKTGTNIASVVVSEKARLGQPSLRVVSSSIVNLRVVEDVSSSTEYDAVVLAGGSRNPRDLTIPGRDLKGIYFAMEYLTQSNKKVSDEKFSNEEINAKGKKVVVIGGGDTGSDCVGTANRQGAACVVQIEIMPKLPIIKTTSSHEEGCERNWSIMTKRFKPAASAVELGHESRVTSLECVQVDAQLKEIQGTEFEIEADLVFLALGFLGPEKKGLIEELGLELDNRGNIKTNEDYMTSKQDVFAAGDARRGQSLIVWAISEGRRAAYSVDKYLTGKSILPII